jgi:hypothetical protein
MYRETSALTGKGVSEVFEDACEQYLKNNPTAVGMKRPTRIDLKDGSKPKGGCC